MRYDARDGWVVGHNRNLFCNRNIFANNTNAFISAGDKPLMRFGKQRDYFLTLMCELSLGSARKPVWECGDIVSQYKSGLMEWILRDEAFEGEIRAYATAPEGKTGFAAKIELPAGVRARLRFGGMLRVPGEFSISPMQNPKERVFAETAFDPEWARGNVLAARDGYWEISDARTPYRACAAADVPFHIEGDVFVSDEFTGSVYFYAEALEESRAPSLSPRDAFQSGLARTERLNAQMSLSTPWALLDAIGMVAAGDIDGVWYPPTTVHGSIRWSVPFLGWLTKYGHALCGRHDRIYEEAKFYLSRQHAVSDKTSFEADPQKRLMEPAPDARFYGLGHIDMHQHWYNMQTQFFHQLIHAWRFSGEKRFEALLYPALKLHSIWQDECFFRDGLYESVINTWPTDSVWCGGAGAVEETCYAYAVKNALCDMARRNGDAKDAERYAREAENIRRAFMEKLWLKDKGYAAAYRDVFGDKLAQEEAWIYSAFLPVETGMVADIDAVSSLSYPIWHLQNDELPSGGTLVWQSNWTPGIWSLRERSNGENLQYAYACLIGGLPERGMQIVRGVVGDAFDTEFMAALDRPVIESQPLLLRVIVEGIFGYHPDYPNGRVDIAPNFPFDWRDAYISNGDIEIRWHRDEHVSELYVRLKKAARVSLRIPLYAREVEDVTGVSRFTVEPGFGRRYIAMEAGEGREFHGIARTRGETRALEPIFLCARGGECVSIPEDVARVEDPQGIIASLEPGFARLKDIGGTHMLVFCDSLRIRRAVYVDMGKSRAEQALEEKQFAPVPEGARYETVDLRGVMKGDIQSIYRRKYLSPRPNTISAQIGNDGFSAWTFHYWKIDPPTIALTRAGSFTPQGGAPVSIACGPQNVAFVSVWDNDPDEIEIPIGKRAHTAYLLLACSTNPMRCGMPNAVVRFRYARETPDELPLVPPRNIVNIASYPERAASTMGVGAPRVNVFHETDAFCLPERMPVLCELGENLLATQVAFRLKDDQLEAISVRAVVPDVIIGVMAVTLAL